MPTAQEFLAEVSKITGALDETNIKIISMMNSKGPRNLLEVARTLHLPAATVHSRMRKLEAQGLLSTFLNLRYSKLGLERILVTVKTVAGKFDLAKAALKIPGYWSQSSRCLGLDSDLFSSHHVPVGKSHHVTSFLETMKDEGIVSSFNITKTGDENFLFQDFACFDVATVTWRFPWRELAQRFLTEPTLTSVESIAPARYEILCDRLDLLIIRDLEANARTKFSQMTPATGVTLQAVKYRYDNLFRRKVIDGFVTDVPRYPRDIAVELQVQLEAPKDGLIQLYANCSRLPFVHAISCSQEHESLFLRLRLAAHRISELLDMLTLLAARRVIVGFSPLLLDSLSLETKPLPVELFRDQGAWVYEHDAHIEKLRQLKREWRESNQQALASAGISPHFPSENMRESSS